MGFVREVIGSMVQEGQMAKDFIDMLADADLRNTLPGRLAIQLHRFPVWYVSDIYYKEVRPVEDHLV